MLQYVVSAQGSLDTIQAMCPCRFIRHPRFLALRGSIGTVVKVYKVSSRNIIHLLCISIAVYFVSIHSEGISIHDCLHCNIRWPSLVYFSRNTSTFDPILQNGRLWIRFAQRSSHQSHNDYKTSVYQSAGDLRPCSQAPLGPRSLPEVRRGTARHLCDEIASMCHFMLLRGSCVQDTEEAEAFTARLRTASCLLHDRYVVQILWSATLIGIVFQERKTSLILSLLMMSAFEPQVYLRLSAFGHSWLWCWLSYSLLLGEPGFVAWYHLL